MSMSRGDGPEDFPPWFTPDEDWEWEDWEPPPPPPLWTCYSFDDWLTFNPQTKSLLALMLGGFIVATEPPQDRGERRAGAHVRSSLEDEPEVTDIVRKRLASDRSLAGGAPPETAFGVTGLHSASRGAGPDVA